MNECYNDVKRTLIIVLALNISIAVIKITYGHLTNILSISADGYDAMLDSVANIIGIVAVIIASKPHDASHQYGYSKIETFASILIGVSLLIVSYEIITTSIERFTSGMTPIVGITSFAVMILNMIIKLFIYYYEGKKAKELSSDLLLSDSKHIKGDVYSTIVIISGLVFMKMGYAILDPILSIVIALLIVKNGIGILHNNVNVLIDSCVIEPVEIEKCLMQVDGVENVHNIRTRGTASCVWVDMHIIVDSDMSMKEAHDISVECEKVLHEAYPTIEEVLIHLESDEGIEDEVIFE